LPLLGTDPQPEGVLGESIFHSGVVLPQHSAFGHPSTVPIAQSSKKITALQYTLITQEWDGE